MNFARLIETIKSGIDYTAFSVLRDDFMENYRDEYKKLRPCKSTMEKAIEKYITKTATMKGEKTATYTQGTTVLLLNKEPEIMENLPRKEIVETATLEMLKDRKPSHCYFMDSIALYKAFKKQDKNTRYFLHIDGHYFDAALVSDMVECIADQKEKYITCEICTNGALFIRQAHAAIILPVNKHSHNAAENINTQDFYKFLDDIEKEYIEEIKKTA